MNLMNILKLAFLTIALLLGITYVFAPKPSSVTDELIPQDLTLASLPIDYELVGKDGFISKNELFKTGQRTLIVVGNQDSMAVINKLPKYFNLDIAYVTVANISNAPWFIKKMAILPKLEELTKDDTTPMIYDYNGWMVKALKLNNMDTVKFFAYLLDENGQIKNIYEGKVKKGAIEGNMTDTQIQESLRPLVKLLEK